MSTTHRLFWDDPYQRTFEATVQDELLWQGRPAVTLDRTCFYATSGGQPNDLGTLNGTPVLDVVEDEQGRLLHILARPLDGAQVRGDIDWSRRLDHMQQHTGQHILSAAFERLLGAETVSFHLGEETCTIDLNLASIEAPALARVEDVANQVVQEDRAVMVRVYAQGEIAEVPLRKPPKVDGAIRVVSVVDFDACACGGTHVSSTGQVGSIHIRRCERQRGNVRIEFLCGSRAVADYRKRDAALQELANRLSVGVDELADAVARVQEAEAEARHRAEALRKRLLDALLPELIARAEAVGPYHLVCQVLEDFDAGTMRYIAQQLIMQPGMVALLAVHDPSPQFCFARALDVPVDMGQVLREVASPLGGKGGGKPNMAQGGGVAPEHLSQMLEAARARVSR